MAEIIELDAVYRDCANCEEPTRFVCGTAFDMDGPGVCSPLYDCENKDCKRRQDDIARYIIRKTMPEPPKEDTDA